MRTADKSKAPAKLIRPEVYVPEQVTGKTVHDETAQLVASAFLKKVRCVPREIVVVVPSKLNVGFVGAVSAKSRAMAQLILCLMIKFG